MNKTPLISVIVPVYKVEKFLNRCVESIVNQTYKNLEIILVDDGSPDNCPKMCDEWAQKDKRIKIIHQKNSGVSSARNNGIKQATGDYIAFVDSDDWIEPETYESVLNLALSENADLTFFKYLLIDENGNKQYLNEINLCKEKIKNLEYYFLLNSRNGNDSHTIMGSIVRVLFKSNIIKDMSFNTNLKLAEDLLFLLHVLAKTDRISVCDKYYYNYFFNVNSASRLISKQYFINLKTYYETFKDYFISNDIKLLHLINNQYLYNNVMQRIYNKNYIKELKELLKNDKTFIMCLNKNDYKKIKTYNLNKAAKLRNFLLYHKMWRIIRLLQKLRKSK